MSYFAAKHTTPELATPTGLRLWPGDDGAYTLVWQRPLGRIEGFVVLGGADPAALCELARLAANATHWQVPLNRTGWLAVACVRGEHSGPPSACVSLPEEQAAEMTPCNAPVEAVEQPHAPFGRCVCCAPGCALMLMGGSLACPQTAAAHVLLGSGAALLVADLPYGLCVCCDPVQPLIRSGEAVVCYARPESRAIAARASNGVPNAFTPNTQGDANAIDAALRANSALLGVNGVFVE